MSEIDRAMHGVMLIWFQNDFQSGTSKPNVTFLSCAIVNSAPKSLYCHK